MGGDAKGRFSPKGPFTTEQAIATMLRMFESVVGEKAGYSGGVIAPEEPQPAPARGSGLMTADDNDATGFEPRDWSWIAEGEGYGRRYFTSGKYVRDDGRAVLYIESSDSFDSFSFQLFALAGGAHQDNYEAYDYSCGSSYVWAEDENDGLARDASNGLIFRNYGNGLTVVETDWIDEMYFQYDDPAGYYYLVREKM